MGTCLKKQLKSETSANLPVYNALNFVFDGASPANKYTLNTNVGSNYQLIAVGGTKIFDSTGNTELESPVSASWNQTFRLTYSKGDGLIITGKYGMVWYISPYNALDVHLNIVEELAPCLNLSNFAPCAVYSSNLNITGEITEFAEKQVSYGRTSGSVQFGPRTGITLNGNTFDNTVTIKYGSSMENPTEEETAQGYQIA